MLPAASSSLRAASFALPRASFASFSSWSCRSATFCVHRVLALRERLRLALPRRALLSVEARDFGGDVLLLVRELLGLSQRVLHVAIAAARSGVLSFCCASRSLSSAAAACAPPSFDPFAAACRIASAASCSCRAASCRF